MITWRDAANQHGVWTLKASQSTLPNPESPAGTVFPLKAYLQQLTVAERRRSSHEACLWFFVLLSFVFRGTIVSSYWKTDFREWLQYPRSTLGFGGVAGSIFTPYNNENAQPISGWDLENSFLPLPPTFTNSLSVIESARDIKRRFKGLTPSPTQNSFRFHLKITSIVKDRSWLLYF